MKKILENLALIDLIEFCKENGIDCSGTRLAKNGRGYSWSLVKGIAGQAIVTTTFHKSSVPTHYIHEQ